MVTHAIAPNVATATPASNGTARESTRLTVRARTTCAGAHVHVGSLKMQHEDVADFAARYQEQPATSDLARLTASAVNDIKGVLAPRMALRVHAVTATAIADQDAARTPSAVDLRLEIESPETDGALERLVDEWRREYAAALLPTGAAIDITWRAMDWYGS